ncbi:MAG: sortase [Clostridia bacterium]|nr:sortase [Clostridia bacterium]
MKRTDIRSRLGTVLIVLGVFAVAAAGLLYLSIDRDDRQAQEASQATLDRIIANIPEKQAPAEVREPAPHNGSELSQDDELYRETVIDVDGLDYLGYLSFSGAGLRLPVLADWDFDRLRSAPARYAGSAATDDLVIAGHNYKAHFKLLSSLAQGDEIVFTDAQGLAIRYLVRETETLEATAIEEMTAGEWDMTLFTCTYGGQARVAVRCERRSGND